MCLPTDWRCCCCASRLVDHQQPRVSLCRETLSTNLTTVRCAVGSVQPLNGRGWAVWRGVQPRRGLGRFGSPTQLGRVSLCHLGSDRLVAQMVALNVRTQKSFCPSWRITGFAIFIFPLDRTCSHRSTCCVYSSLEFQPTTWYFEVQNNMTQFSRPARTQFSSQTQSSLQYNLHSIHTTSAPGH